MPKITKATPEEKALAAEIRECFDGAFLLTLTQVGQVIGAKSLHTVRDWVRPLVPCDVGKKKTYMVSDVAHHILYGSRAGA